MIPHDPDAAWREPRILRAVDTFFAGWRFPVLALSLLAGFSAILLGLSLVPAGDGALASFAAEFRAWCYGESAATGRMEWASLAAAGLSPLLLGALIARLWQQPLRAARPAGARPVVGMASVGLALVALVAAGMVLAAGTPRKGPLPFPAEDLRTSIPAPPLELTDHDGQVVSLEALRGRVVLVTAVYSRCSSTCPMILAQEQRVLAALSDAERAGLSVLAITLDPAHDDQVVLAEVARGRGLDAPLHHLMTGAPEDVSRALDALGFERQRDADTGVISHSNLFILVDRSGRIAYRFTLGGDQEAWLVEALRVLLQEPPPPRTTANHQDAWEGGRDGGRSG